MSQNPPDSGKPGATLRARLAWQLDPPAGKSLAPPIPDHTLLRSIGEGACGEVWLARNALGTLRAVKIVYRDRFKDDRPYEREFDGILKYEPISRTHEGLVQVLHVGRNEESGCFYYVMELADSVESEREARVDESPPQAFSTALYSPRTLRSELAHGRRLSPTVAAQCVLRLAKALGYLHAQGLVHRDIKPGNVIFVSGQPKLADIGLVTDVGSSQSFVGTEGFIPPEGPGTPQADLYALGKLLYELASGCDRLEFPRLPPDIAAWPDREAYLELNEIMSRACAPAPSARYGSATELEAELDLFLSGRSLRRARNLERAFHRLKQFALLASVLLGIAATALWFSKREERHALERFLTEADLRQRAEAAERESREKLFQALLEQARATVRSGELGQRVRALDAIRQAAAISNAMELRREALAALTLPDLRFERALPLGSDYMVRALDPSFERIALCRGKGPVEIRGLPDGRMEATLPATTNLMCYGAVWSRDGQFLAVKRDHPPAGTRCDLEVWKADEPRLVLLVRGVHRNARSFHPLRPELMTADQAGLTVAWDLETGKVLWRRQLEIVPENLAYSPEGDRFAASHRLGNAWSVSIHDTRSGAAQVSTMTGSNLISALDWQPGGRWVALTDYGGAVRVLDSASGELRTLGRHKAEATTLVFSPEGHYLLTGGWERELICWDMRGMQRALNIALDSYIAQFRSDASRCALLTVSGIQLHVFEHPSGHRRFADDLGPRLRHAAFSPDGKRLAAAADGKVGVWDLAAAAPAGLASGGSDTQLFWTDDANELYGSSRSQAAYRWGITSGRTGSPLGIEPLRLAVPEGFVSLNLASNRVVWTTTHGGRISALGGIPAGNDTWADTIQGTSGVSPDREWLGVFRPYGTVLHVYRLPDLKPVALLTNPAPIAGFCFSPSGGEVGIGSRGHVQFWSTISWERLRASTNFIGLSDVGVIFQPDGRTVWLARDSRTAGLFDSQTFQPILFLPTGMLPLALSRDGRQLAVSVDAQRLDVWDLDSVRAVFQQLGLTSKEW